MDLTPFVSNVLQEAIAQTHQVTCNYFFTYKNELISLVTNTNQMNMENYDDETYNEKKNVTH